MGRLVPKKGFQLLPEVCRILNEAGLDFRLRVVGDGPLDPRLRRSVEQGRLQDRLRLEGACSQEKLIRDYLRRADILVMPCMIASDGDRDGIPTVILEAMSMGVPVVATAVAGIPEVVLDRKTGILVEPDSPQAIADGIIRLIADPELGDRLARTGRDRVRAMFDRHKNVGRLARLFEGEAA